MDYTGKIFSVLDAYLTEKEPSVKFQLLNIFKDHYIFVWADLTAIGNNGLWMKFTMVTIDTNLIK